MRMRNLGALEVSETRLWDPELRFDVRPSAGKGREHPRHSRRPRPRRHPV
jgi:hypothetical protein